VQHADIMQAGALGGHTTKQPPQFPALLVVSTHVSPQHVSPGAQPVTRQPPPVHTESKHICPGLHARPQPPQFAGSALVFVSHPVEKSASQSA